MGGPVVENAALGSGGGLPVVEPPHSIAQARVDEKGRLKLPSEFLEYLKKLGVDKVFITTLDRQLARIYPISVWKANENLFAERGRPGGDRRGRGVHRQSVSAAIRRSTRRDAC